MDKMKARKLVRKLRRIADWIGCTPLGMNVWDEHRVETLTEAADMLEELSKDGRE